MKKLLASLLLLLFPQAASQSVLPVPQEQPMVAATYNAMVRDNGDGTKTSEIHGKWLNYLDAGYQWQPIDPTISQTATGFIMHKDVFQFRAPLTAAGEATFYADNRFNAGSKQNITDPPMSMQIQALDAQPVPGQTFNMDGNTDAVLYPNAFPQWNADLIYYVREGSIPTLQKLIRWNTAPPADVSARFLLHEGETPDITHKKKKWAGARLITSSSLSFFHKGSSARGIGFQDFRIWDSGKNTPEGQNQKIAPVQVDFEKSGTGYLLTKHIPVSFFQNVTYPVFTDSTLTSFPDPSTGATTVDGELYNEQTPYSTNHDSATCTNPDPTRGDIYVQVSAAFSIRRDMFLFDTSSIGSSATVSAATFSVFATNVTRNDSSDSVRVVTASPASNNNLVAADFNKNNFGTTGLATDKLVSAFATSAYLDYSITDLTTVSKTSITKYGLRLVTLDIGNTSPGAAGNYANMDSADTAGTSNDPKLVVTYTPGSATTNHSQYLSY